MLGEPSLGLAPILVEDVFKTIAWIHGEGKLVLRIEQHVNEALSSCSRGVCLRMGGLSWMGMGNRSWRMTT